MLILLPPSEAKDIPQEGDPVSLSSLVFAERLTEHRSALLDALERLADAPVEQAVEMLSISTSQAGEIALNAALRKAPAVPAATLYTGTLYDRLDLSTLPASAHERVLIASALWGFVRTGDRIPYYRLSPKARLDDITLAPWWREALIRAMPDDLGALVIDMRSTAYAAAWKPVRSKIFSVRAFYERNGERKSITHMAKAVRGEVARALLLAEEEPTSPEEAAAIATGAGFTVELTDSTLDVIVTR